MISKRSEIQHIETRQLLLEGTYKAIPFNVILGFLLAMYLAHSNVPIALLGYWLGGMFVVSAIRMWHCKFLLNTLSTNGYSKAQIHLFVLLCALAGITWAVIYFASLPYSSELQQYTTILVFGGMAAGATTSLSIYFPSFMAYVLGIFIPVIVHNLLTLETDHIILAFIFAFFILALTIIAKTSNSLIIEVFHLTTKNRSLVEKLEQLSITDSLTGLYNKRHFNNSVQMEMNRARRNQQSTALISIDLDNFKLINDNLGHPFGDQFLVNFAEYIRNYFRRASDTSYRLGGDEFAVIALDTTDKNIHAICDLLISQFNMNLRHNYKEEYTKHEEIFSQVSISIGAVFIPAESTTSVDLIIEQADSALYEAKNKGKNRAVYTRCI